MKISVINLSARNIVYPIDNPPRQNVCHDHMYLPCICTIVDYCFDFLKLFGVNYSS